MRILVCVKRVPAPGAKINITPDGQAVDTAFLGFAVSPHEECAVEAAIQLVEQHGGDSTVLSLGPPEAEEQLRDAVSRGANHIVLAATDGMDWDPQRTAAALVSAIRDLEAANGTFDLILFGNESADSGGFQVGVRCAVALDRPMVNAANGLEVNMVNAAKGLEVNMVNASKGLEVDANGSTVTVRRESDAGVEVYSLSLPAIVGVKEGINLPRYPTMRGRVASRKATLDTTDASAEPGGQSLIALSQPPEVASSLVILGHGPDAAPAVVDVFEELGVL